MASSMGFCYTLVKNSTECEIGEIEKPLIDKGFKRPVASLRLVQLGRQAVKNSGLAKIRTWI